jgi:hypothetical protein
MTKYYPAQPNSFAQGAPDVKIPNTMDPKYRDIGAKTKIVKRRATLKSSNTQGPTKYYGFRAFMTKEAVEPQPEKHPLKAMKSLLEADEGAVPELVLKEIKSNIRKGARDLEQKWANALELTNKAYQVTNIQKPLPDNKPGWKQYEEMIAFAVKQLAAARGMDSDWRSSQVLVKESLSKRRFFVTIPGAGQTEVDAKNMDEIIEGLMNRLRRHGVKVRIEKKHEGIAVVSFWVDDVKTEEITIRDVSLTEK